MSEQKLDALIAKVKSEAIEAAEKEAKEIINDAKQKAKQGLANAEAEKIKLLNNAHIEAKAIMNKGEIALKQAARDLQISIKNDLLKLLKSVLEAEVEGTFTADLYSKIILQITESVGNNTEISLPETTKTEIVDAIRKNVAASKNTVDIIKSKQLFSGLSITKKDEGWRYDITAEEITNLLSKHLSKKWLVLLNSK
jgi:F0F1-type ATP synthase membrane subunit b/b'